MVSLSIAGGVLRDAPLNKLTPDSVRAVFAPKVDGASNLLQSSWAAPLAPFNAFSSVASFIGSAGQGNYAAANSVLDAWAADAQAAGISGARPISSKPFLAVVVPPGILVSQVRCGWAIGRCTSVLMHVTLGVMGPSMLCFLT